MKRRGLRWAAAGVAVYLAAVLAYIQLAEHEPQAVAKPRAATPPVLNFTQGFPGPDRAWVRKAIAPARPEAQALIRKVAPRTHIEAGHDADGLTSDRLRRRMVSEIPGDAPAAEKFADTFAKWALHVDGIPGGYDVPTPRSKSIEEWGAPLAEIAARLEAAPRTS